MIPELAGGEGSTSEHEQITGWLFLGNRRQANAADCHERLSKSNSGHSIIPRPAGKARLRTVAKAHRASSWRFQKQQNLIRSQSLTELHCPTITVAQISFSL